MMKKQNMLSNMRSGLGLLFCFDPKWMRSLGIFLLILSLCVWLDLTLQEPNVFPIQRVLIEGDYPHIDKTNLETMLTPLMKAGFFSVDVQAIQDQVAQLPWVAGAKIRRIWPDKIVMTLNEHQAVANWDNEGLLDDEGNLFHPDPKTFPDNVPIFTGPKGTHKKMMLALKNFNTILAHLHLSVKAMRLSPSLSYTLELNNQLVLIVGQHDEEKRLQRFVDAYDQVNQTEGGKTIAYADLRYVNGFALGFH
jgi:cell division protein FtsQ